MNSKIINILEEFAQISSIVGEVYKEKAYHNAINIIKHIDWELNNENIDKKIPGIGKNIFKKIQEFLRTGEIKELIRLKNKKEIVAYSVFSKIIGVGPATISEWIRNGIYTLSDLRKSISTDKIVLNNMQKYGLMYYIDLNEKISRGEMEFLINYFTTIIKRIDVRTIVTPCGSYRRKMEFSGDVDILISGPFYDANILKKIAAVLSNDINYIDYLSIGKERIIFLYRSFYNKIPKVRQIDIFNIPYNQYWPAVLYATGSWEFNENMRGYARYHGFKLNQKGLFKSDKLIVTNSEEEIFEKLNLKYVPCELRTSDYKFISI
jgi:DNA polymerase/3'-5' exonuclease PolX